MKQVEDVAAAAAATVGVAAVATSRGTVVANMAVVGEGALVALVGAGRAGLADE